MKYSEYHFHNREIRSRHLRPAKQTPEPATDKAVPSQERKMSTFASYTSQELSSKPDSTNNVETGAILGYTLRKSFNKALNRLKKTQVMRQVRVLVNFTGDDYRDAEKIPDLSTILGSGSSHHICKIENMLTNLVLKSIGHALTGNSGSIPMYGHG
jgi:hypothetical protein